MMPILQNYLKKVICIYISKSFEKSYLYIYKIFFFFKSICNLRVNMETILMKSSLLKESVMTPQWLWENLKRFCSGIKCPLLILFRWIIYSYWLQSPVEVQVLYLSILYLTISDLYSLDNNNLNFTWQIF